MSCVICDNSKADLRCGLCEVSLCKGCTVFVDEERFDLLSVRPPALTLETFCHCCYTDKVQPEIEAYEALVEKAKAVLVFEKKQGKETRLVSRKEKPVRVQNCKDHDGTIMRMAVAAVQAGYNAIVDVKITTQKIKDGSYSTLLYSGESVPAHIDEARLPRDRSLWHQPN